MNKSCTALGRLLPRPGVITTRVLEPLKFDPDRDHNSTRLELQRRFAARLTQNFCGRL